MGTRPRRLLRPKEGWGRLVVEKGGLWWWKREKSTILPESRTIEAAAMAAKGSEEGL